MTSVITKANADARKYSRNAASRPRALIGLLILLTMLLAMPARAADVVFPTGSSVGLVPPGDMKPSPTFQGFSDLQHNATMVMTALPAEAYATLEKSSMPDVLRSQGASITVDKREPFALDAGKGFLITGVERSDKARYHKWVLVAAVKDATALVVIEVPEQDTTYTDKVLRAALATVTVRAEVPDAERLSLLPFAVNDLAGFHIADVLAGRAVMLVDAPAATEPGAAPAPLRARLLIGAVPGGPKEPDDRPNFARLAFDSISGIKDVHIQMSEPLRIGGQPGFQTLAQASDAQAGISVMVVQWLRFGGGAFIQIIGIGRADVWNDEFTRMRAIRDGVEPK